MLWTTGGAAARDKDGKNLLHRVVELNDDYTGSLTLPPATNNISERQLRRQATGRNNWLFIGSEDGAEVNTTFTTLVATCRMLAIEPEAYLRDLLCLLPGWPPERTWLAERLREVIESWVEQGRTQEP